MPKAVHDNRGGRQRGRQGRNRQNDAIIGEALSQGDVSEYKLEQRREVGLCIEVSSCFLLKTKDKLFKDSSTL